MCSPAPTLLGSCSVFGYPAPSLRRLKASDFSSHMRLWLAIHSAFHDNDVQEYVLPRHSGDLGASLRRHSRAQRPSPKRGLSLSSLLAGEIGHDAERTIDIRAVYIGNQNWRTDHKPSASTPSASIAYVKRDLARHRVTGPGRVCC